MHEHVSPEGQLAHPLSHSPARTRTVSRAGLSPTPAEDSSLRPQETQPPQQALSRRQTTVYACTRSNEVNTYHPHAV